MDDYQELIERLRDISAMCDAIESLLNALDVAEGEVKRTAAERDAALSEHVSIKKCAASIRKLGEQE